MQTQYSQGAATSHHSSYASTEISGNGGSITSSLRQWRKKDYVEKQQSTDTTTSVAENTSHVARVAPHTYYPPRPANDVCHYQHQYSEYGDPYKPPAVAPVKYSEIVENQSQPIDNIASIIPKHKEKEYVDFPPQPHLKQYQDLPLKPPYPDNIKQPYSDQFMIKESQMPPYMQKQPQMHQYRQKEPYQQFLSKYNMQNQYPPQPPYPSEPNNFLAHLNKINPRMAQSIINDTHLRDSQIPMYHNLEQGRTYPQSQRVYHGPPMNSSPTHPHRNLPPQPYNYPQPYNCNVKQGSDPYNRIQYQHNVPKYLPDYKMNSPVEPTIPNISPQSLYNERLHINYDPLSPNYPHNNQLEYAQHYQHRRQIPPEYFSHPGYKPSYMDNLHMAPDDNCPGQRGRKPSLKQYLETWVDEDIAGNLPDIIISNNMNEQNIENNIKSAVCVKNSDRQEQPPLYVLDTTEIPDENLPHFLHLQQFEKLPDNIRGYYHSANAGHIASRRIIVENAPTACGASQVIRNDPKGRTEIAVDRMGNECCTIGKQNKIGNTDGPGIIMENPVQSLENKVVQIHIIEEPDASNSSTNMVESCSAADTVIVKSNLYQHNLILNSDGDCLIKQRSQPLHTLDSDTVKDNVKNMPVIDDGFNADETSDCLGTGSLTQSEDSSSNQSNSDEHSDDAFVSEKICREDMSSGISSIYKEMISMQNENTNTVLENSANTVLDSGNCDDDLNESKSEKCIPVHPDSESLKFDNEINEYLHSSSDNIVFSQTSNTLHDTTDTLTFDTFTFSNTDVDNIANSQTDVNLSKNINTNVESDELLTVNAEKDDVSDVDNVKNSSEENILSEEVNPSLKSVVEETSKIHPSKELWNDVEQTLEGDNLVNSDDKNSIEEDRCEDIKTDENTKEVVSENSTVSDQSSDDDNSMPDIDKYVEQTIETNQTESVEHNKGDLPSTNTEESNLSYNENCDKSKCIELSSHTDIQEKTEDFEKPPDLTDSKFGTEIKKRHRSIKKSEKVNQVVVDEKLSNVDLKDANSPEVIQLVPETTNEVNVILEKVSVTQTSVPFEDVESKKETEVEAITKDKSHAKHKIKSDKVYKKHKEEKEKLHDKDTKTDSKPEIGIEMQIFKDKEQELTQNRVKSATKDKESNEPKQRKVRILPPELLQKSETSVSIDINNYDISDEVPAKNDALCSEVSMKCSTDKNNERQFENTPSIDCIKETDCSKLLNNTDTLHNELQKTSLEESNTNAVCPPVEENAESLEEPLTMIKVEQTYLEETYENANTNVIYQIADNNVVLQIADELLEINVTTYNGRKVIFVKTLTDAVILSNCDENDLHTLDLEPEEELRYEKICEDVEILLNNNYITDTRISNNNYSENEFCNALKEVSEEPDVPVVAGDEVCIPNEEIVSSSTSMHENPPKCDDSPEKSPIKPKKVVTWEDEKLKHADFQEPSLRNTDNLQEQTSVPLTRPKTKAALKYVETNIEFSLKQNEHRSITDKTIEKSKKSKEKTKSSKSHKHKEENDKSCEKQKTKSKTCNIKSGQNTDDSIKIIEQSTKSKKRKALSPLKNTPRKKESLPVKIEKEKIETHVLKTKIHKNKSKVESPTIVKDNAVEDTILNSSNKTKLQEEVKVSVNILCTDILQPVPVEISKKCEEKLESVIMGAVENDVEKNQISVQENSITSSTSVQETELVSKPSERKLAQQISEEWEEESDEIKVPPPVATKKRLSLEEYNNRKRSHHVIEQIPIQESDLTNNLLDNINNITNKREVSPESPVLSVNFNNKTYSRNFGTSTNLGNRQDDSLSNSIELQLPKISRIPQKPVYSEEYLQNALRNDLYTVNAFTASLIKENQQLMQRFLNQQRLTLDELKKVKQIIRYKRLIQQLTTLKINGLNSSAKQDFSIRQNVVKRNIYDLDKGHSSATKVTMKDPLKPFGCEPEKRRKKRFKFLYSDNESILNPTRKLPSTLMDEERDSNCSKRPRLDESTNPSESGESRVGYSVSQGNSESQLTLVFKRSVKNDPKMQPFVKLERLFSIDQLAKNRFY